MAKSIRGITKKRRGRPKTTGKGEPILVRLHADLLKPLDQWIKDQPSPKPSRPDAVRTALTDWLTGLGLLRLTSKKVAKRKAGESSEIAGQTIDRLEDPSASPDERAQRKRRLLKGPKEFREMRDDLPPARNRRK